MVVKTLCDPRIQGHLLATQVYQSHGFSVIGDGSGIRAEWHNGIESVKDILR